MKYAVDLVISSGMRNYERTKPIRDNKTTLFEGVKGLNDHDPMFHYYVDASGPVYVIDGSAGNNIYFKKEDVKLNEFSVLNDFSVGYSIATIYNSSHLKVEHIEANSTRIIDWFYIIHKSGLSLLEKFKILIIAGVAGAVVLLCIIICCIVYCCKKKKKAEHDPLQEEEQ
jgi:hypothetical protein